MKFAILFAAASLAAGTAMAQATGPLEWRRTDMSSDTFGATGFTAEVDGIRRVAVVVRAPADRTSQAGTFRGVVFQTEVRCQERRWRITGITYYAADYSVVSQIGAVPEAPLIRETPLHAAITDVCDGGHTGPIGLTTDDPVEVQRWLDGL